MLTLLISGSTLQHRQEHLHTFLGQTPFPPIFLDGQNQKIPIKQVRQFQSQIILSIPQNRHQIHCILEAQNLTLPAQHALLKTLEEPPPQTQIILTVDRPNSLLPTILSRCQLIKLHQTENPNLQDSKDFLKQIITSNHAQLIHLAQDLAKKSTTSDQIKNLIQLLRDSIHNYPSSNRSKALQIISITSQDLNTNINPQIALEHLFFTLKHLSRS